MSITTTIEQLDREIELAEKKIKLAKLQKELKSLELPVMTISQSPVITNTTQTTGHLQVVTTSAPYNTSGVWYSINDGPAVFNPAASVTSWPASEEMWSTVEKPHYLETTYCLKSTKEK